MSAMTRFDKVELTKAVHATLRAAAAVSNGAMHFPYKEGVVWTERRAQKAPRPLQWILERETFEREVVSQYAQLEQGVIRELIAGTGVGKTTVMPFLIAQHHRVNGIIVVPKQTYALRGMKYLVPKLAVQGGHVRVSLLRSSSLTQPVQSPVVYYSDAETLLARIATNPTLLRDLGIDFIFLDESHEGSHGYKFFPYAVTTGIISGVKIFYGTATGASDLTMESTTRRVVSVDPRIMSVENPLGATTQSPLHHANISNRTIVLLATDAEIVMWHNYYTEHDIPSYPCEAARGHSVENGIDEFLDANPVCVLLVYSMYRTSITANLDVVICSGYYQRAVSDFVEGTVSLVRTPVTQALRVQGCGRVARYKPGTAYYSNVEVSPPEAINDDTAFGVYLWSVVFNVRINEPVISRFAGLVEGAMSPLAAAVLLHSRLPPLLMLPYTGDKGFYAGWDGVAEYVLFTHGGVGMCDTSPVNTDKWTEYSTGVVSYVNVPYSYRSAVRFPREWNSIPAYAWELFRGNKPAVDLMRAASVISAAPTEVFSTNKARFSSVTLASDKSLWTSGRTSLETLRKPPASVRSLSHNGSVNGTVKPPRSPLPSVADVQMRYSLRDSLPVLKTPRPVSHHSRQESIESVLRPELDRLSEWQNETALALRTYRQEKSPPRSIARRAGSDSSDDRTLFPLETVDPVKFKYYKLYPMDQDLFRRLMENQTYTRSDRTRVEKLLTASDSLGKMRGDAATRDEKHSDYLLSVLRAHNAMLLQKVQVAANPASSTKEKVITYLNGDAKHVDKVIDQTARLLHAFQIESYFVGIDKRLPRTSTIMSDAVTPDYDYEEARAKIMMCFGPAEVVSMIDKILASSVPVFAGEKCVGNAWKFGNVVVSAQHVCAKHDVEPVGTAGVVSDDSDDDCIVYKADVPVSKFVELRDHIAGSESVYIVTHDSAVGKAVVLGDYVYMPAGDIAYVNTVLDKGTSGALLVSVNDGAVLGMYVAYFADMQSGPVSLVVPAAKFAKYLI